jgi:SAM-dependent methyltransferase
MPPAGGRTAAGVVLDCACGIGTQTLGLARAGYLIEGTDLSGPEIERAQAEAVARGLDIAFRVDDMRELRTCELGRFGVVLAFDNALPHLDSDDEVRQALGAMRDRLRPEAKLLISLRDYGPLMEQRPAATPPTMFLDDGRRRIVHQIWDWRDERRYSSPLHHTPNANGPMDYKPFRRELAGHDPRRGCQLCGAGRNGDPGVGQLSTQAV